MTVQEALADAHRSEWAAVLAATVRVTRDLDLAEECTQDAYTRALQVWPRDGVPARPGAWLTTVARNRALDLARREVLLRRALPLLVVDEPAAPVRDDRLRLIFTCCHPALPAEARVALTLRLLCGLTTAEVARAFLVREPAMAARITRAKKKIAAARIPYRVPSPEELPVRLPAVLDVVHLVFTTGHLARRDLVDSAIALARTLHSMLPDDPGVLGLLALLLLTDSRRPVQDGRLVLLGDQDRAAWDHARIREGVTVVRAALARRPLHRYAVQAAIAAVHAEAPSLAATDWAESAGSTTSCASCGRTRSWTSTAPWRSACATARSPDSPPSSRCVTSRRWRPTRT